MTLPPIAYTPPPVSSLLTLEMKHSHPPYIYNVCLDGRTSDDDLINNNITNTADNSQPSIFFDNNPNRELDDDITSKLIFDLEAETATGDAMDATESIVFDNTPNRKFDNDDDLEIDHCTLKFFGLAPPPEHPQYKPQYNHFSAYLIQSLPISAPSNPWHKNMNLFIINVFRNRLYQHHSLPSIVDVILFCKQTQFYNIF